MGCVPRVSYVDFPKQGELLGKRVRVVFNYGRTVVGGECIRDDVENRGNDKLPGLTIFKLDDGRVVLSTECQYNY